MRSTKHTDKQGKTRKNFKEAYKREIMNVGGKENEEKKDLLKDEKFTKFGQLAFLDDLLESKVSLSNCIQKLLFVYITVCMYILYI